MLFDPWLDDGIFHGSWFHWPPISTNINDIGRFDYVYISHIHEDHCSAGTIQYLNRDAEIIIMDRRPNFVENFLKSHDFNFSKVHLVPPRKGLRISKDLFVDMIEANPTNELAFLVDSSIVIQWGDHVVFNANDCQPHPAAIDYLRNTYPKVDLALLPYSGGSGYPSCYSNLSEDEKISERERILEQRIAGFIENTRQINPKYVVPFADQYVVGGSRAYLNRFISHGSCPGVVGKQVRDAGLGERLLLLNSGQSFDLGDQTKKPDVPYMEYTVEDREKYIAEYLSHKPYDHERVTFGPSVSIERLVRQARFRLWDAQRQRQTFPLTHMVLDFNDSQRRFEIDLAVEGVLESDIRKPLMEPYLRMAGSDTLQIMLLMGHISWNIADAALFLDYERRPNVYDPSIYVLLNFLRI